MGAETRSNYYRYVITACDILIPNKEPMKLGIANILGFTIEKDFDNDYFPIFNLQLNLKNTQYYTIIENKTNVKFKIKLEKYAYNNESIVNYKETVFDTIFSVFIDDNSSFIDKSLYNKTEDMLGTVQNLNKYDFYLFKDNDITASKKIFNRVVSRANMTDCIVYLLSMSGSNNVLMTPLENNQVYDDIIIPPTTIIQSLIYLEKQYGFYSHGALFFYDFDTVYFIDKRAECTAYRTGEYTSIITQIYKKMNPNSKTPGNYKDPKTKSYTLYVSHDSMRMLTASIVNEQIQSKDINVIDSKYDTSTVVSPNTQSRNATQSSIVNNFHNKYLNNMINNAKYENDNVLSIDVNDVDLCCFTPNKKFIVSFEDKESNEKHKGNYRLSNYVFTFKKNGEFFVTNGVIQLKKTT